MWNVGLAPELLRRARKAFAVLFVTACLLAGSSTPAAATVYLLTVPDHLTLVDIHAVSSDASGRNVEGYMQTVYADDHAPTGVQVSNVLLTGYLAKQHVLLEFNGFRTSQMHGA